MALQTAILCMSQIQWQEEVFEYQDYLKKWGEVFHNTDGTELYGAPVFFM